MSVPAKIFTVNGIVSPLICTAVAVVSPVPEMVNESPMRPYVGENPEMVCAEAANGSPNIAKAASERRESRVRCIGRVKTAE